MQEQKDLTDMQVRYSANHILRYEFIWGTGWVSPGGEGASRELCHSIASLLKGSRVLDVGSGTGGAAVLMAMDFETKFVKGVDIAKAMVDLSSERLPPILKERIQFVTGDFMSLNVTERFDIVWSRDSFLHIDDKFQLLKKCYENLVEGGTILFTDYCISAKPIDECSPDFQKYLSGRGYSLFTVDRYASAMHEAGFVKIKAENRTDQFLKYLKDELKLLRERKSFFLETFTKDDFTELETGWQSKIQWCSNGDMQWGVFEGTKAG